MDDGSNLSYCFVCKKAALLKGHPSRQQDYPCPHCGSSMADEGIPWVTLRGYREGRKLPEVPEVGKVYALS